MKATVIFARACAACLLALASCSLLVDPSEIDQKCASDEKICRGRCVRIDDPAYGCKTGCEPCLPSVQNAIFACGENGECEIAACIDGYGCSGCTTNLLLDPRNCAKCCHAPCNDGGCTTECDDHYEDCDNDPGNGCEAEVSQDPENCGECGVACPRGALCRAGRCE